jgi:hypothetical protein
VTTNERWLALIALVALLVSLRQAHTDAVRLRHELFERRFAMYRAIDEFLADVVRRRRINANAEQRLLDATRGARFLFDRAVADFLEDLHRQRAAFDNTVTTREGSDRSLDETAAAREQHEFDWFKNTASGLEARFAPFLRLEPWWGVCARRLGAWIRRSESVARRW